MSAHLLEPTKALSKENKLAQTKTSHNPMENPVKAAQASLK